MVHDPIPNFTQAVTTATLSGTNPKWTAEEVNTLVLKVEEGEDSDDEEAAGGTVEALALLLELWNENNFQEDDFIGSATMALDSPEDFSFSIVTSERSSRFASFASAICS